MSDTSLLKICQKISVKKHHLSTQYSHHTITYSFMVNEDGFSTLKSMKLSFINNYQRIKKVNFYLSSYLHISNNHFKTFNISIWKWVHILYLIVQKHYRKSVQYVKISVHVKKHACKLDKNVESEGKKWENTNVTFVWSILLIPIIWQFTWLVFIFKTMSVLEKNLISDNEFEA